MKRIGEKYHNLTIISDSGKRYKGGKIFICLCDCGAKKEIRGNALGAHVKSCGCLLRETAKKMVVEMNSDHLNTFSGDCTQQNRTSIYESWRKIIHGCCNRSINSKREPKVSHEYDQRWINFHAFLEDFGQIRRDQTISRLNNKLPWSKDNCFINTGRRVAKFNKSIEPDHDIK